MKKTIFMVILVGFIVLGITWRNETRNREHSFLGEILEVSSSYIIVKPNEDEEAWKISDQFLIDLKNEDTIYEVGANVKINYIGDINESYPAQIEATKIEIDRNEVAKKKYSKTIETVILEMDIPNEWRQEELPVEDNYKFALKLYNDLQDAYFVLYYFNEPFTVCGTGRNEQILDLDNGKDAKIGYYVDEKTWSDISFYDLNSNLAFVNYGTEDNEIFAFVKTLDIRNK